MDRLKAALAVVCLVGWWLCATSAAGYGAPGFLQDRLGFSNSDLGSLARGRPVVKSMKSDNGREVAMAGAIKVNVPVEFFLSRFSDISTFKQSDNVTQIGKFSDPARPDDLEGLTFEPSELDSLRKCRVGDCGIQLGSEQIQQLTARVEWSKPDARVRANELLREMLVEYVQAYRARGNGALIEYRDRDVPVKLGDQWRMLVDHSSALMKEAPEFQDHLLGSPDDALLNEQFIYWSKETFGLKPVITLTHVIVYRPMRSDAPEFVVASKQIYASRYVNSSLALTLGMGEDTLASATAGFYLLYTNRTVMNPAPVMFGAIIRRMAQSQTRAGMEKHLKLTRERLEHDFSTK